jgi:hypothetical protein
MVCFRIRQPISEAKVDQVITVGSSVEHRPLLLDCSLRHFSEGDSSGSFNLSSANARFFSGEISLHMDSVFLLLGHDRKRIIGSPLYLRLFDTFGPL